MKGIILAGGTGSRLFPVTRGVNKHLLPVYDTPLIYFPIRTLKALGATEILLITNPQDIPSFKRLLGVGAELGVSIEYAEQAQAGGIAQGVLIAAEWLRREAFYMALGDNVFFNFHAPRATGATAYVIPYNGADIRRFGIYNPATGRIEEKPAIAPSNLASVGLYHFPACAVERVRRQKPSPRGELEITDLLNSYGEALEVKQISAEWHDCGTFESLLNASRSKKLALRGNYCRLFQCL